MRHPFGLKLLLATLVALSAVSIPSGILLLTSPKGEAIGAQVILPLLTQRVPFISDFAPVGVFLLAVYGLLPLALSYGLWTRRGLAWSLTLLLGVTQIVWIGVEVVLFYDLGYFFFYPIIAGMGAMTVLLSLFPSVRSFVRPTTHIG